MKNLSHQTFALTLISLACMSAYAANPSVADKDGSSFLYYSDGNVSTGETVLKPQENLTGNWTFGNFSTLINAGAVKPDGDGNYALKEYNVKLDGNFDVGFSLSPYSVDGLSFSTSGKTLTITEDLSVDITASSVNNSRLTLNGIYANGGTIRTEGNVKIVAFSSGEHAGNASSITSNAIEANYGTLKHPSDESNVFINYDSATGSVASDKTVQIIGNVKIESGGDFTNEVQIGMANADSIWSGVSSSIPSSGTLGLDISNGAKWVLYDYDYSASLSLSNASEVTNLRLHDAGVVDLSASAFSDTRLTNYVTSEVDATTIHQLTIDNLSGSNGIFKLDINSLDENGKLFVQNQGTGYSDPKNKLSDMLFIANGEGNQFIDFDVSKANFEMMKEGDRIHFANVESGDVTFSTLNSVYNQASNVFSYQYGAVSENVDGEGTNWYVELLNRQGNENENLAKGAMFAAYALATDMDKMNDRRAEARYVNGAESGVWVRYRYGETGWDKTFESDMNMIQVGYDHLVGEENGTKAFLGISFDYAKADTSFDHISGDGDDKRYGGSLYYTILKDTGLYNDLVFRFGRLESDYDMTTMAGQSIATDFHRSFFSISEEFGKRFDLSEQIFVEPQFQIQYAQIDGADYQTESGVSIEEDNISSLITRIGVRGGYEFKTSPHKALPNHIYLRADVLHDFMGDKEYTINGRDGSLRNSWEGDETWFEVGLGTDWSITDGSRFWLDVEKTLGSDFDNTWQVQAGLRFEW